MGVGRASTQPGLWWTGMHSITPLCQCTDWALFATSKSWMVFSKTMESNSTAKEAFWKVSITSPPSDWRLCKVDEPNTTLEPKTHPNNEHAFIFKRKSKTSKDVLFYSSSIRHPWTPHAFVLNENLSNIEVVLGWGFVLGSPTLSSKSLCSLSQCSQCDFWC